MKTNKFQYILIFCGFIYTNLYSQNTPSFTLAEERNSIISFEIGYPFYYFFRLKELEKFSPEDVNDLKYRSTKRFTNQVFSIDLNALLWTHTLFGINYEFAHIPYDQIVEASLDDGNNYTVKRSFDLQSHAISYRLGTKDNVEILNNKVSVVYFAGTTLSFLRVKFRDDKQVFNFQDLSDLDEFDFGSFQVIPMDTENINEFEINVTNPLPIEEINFTQLNFLIGISFIHKNNLSFSLHGNLPFLNIPLANKRSKKDEFDDLELWDKHHFINMKNLRFKSFFVRFGLNFRLEENRKRLDNARKIILENF